MKQEEKELLLRDLCARLPYGVMCFAPDYEYGAIGKLWSVDPFEDLDPEICILYPKGNTISKFYSEVKPYLRPMSSMTEEELNELATATELQYDQLELMDWGNEKTLEFYLEEIPQYCVIKVFDWLNKHHFDYRGLITMGLALEATKDMHKVE